MPAAAEKRETAVPKGKFKYLAIRRGDFKKTVQRVPLPAPPFIYSAPEAKIMKLSFSVVAIASSAVSSTTPGGGGPGGPGKCSDNFVEVTATLALSFCDEHTVRVVKTPSSDKSAAVLLKNRESLMVDPEWLTKSLTPTSSGKAVYITPKLTVKVDLSTETLSFFDTATNTLIKSENGHSFTPSTDEADPTAPNFIAEQTWVQSEGEAIYGGGEFQNGYLNYAKATVQLLQFNTEAIIPFFASSLGYGLLWDNNGWGTLNPPIDPPILINVDEDMKTTVKWSTGDAGDYNFWADMCSDKGDGGLEAVGFGCGQPMNLKINLVDSDGNVLNCQDWDADGSANLPNTMSCPLRNLPANTEYDLHFETSEAGR